MQIPIRMGRAVLIVSLMLGAVAAWSAELERIQPGASEAGAVVDPAAKQGAYSMTEVYVAIGLATAAMLTAGISIIAAAYAVAKIGSAALGAAAEHPDLLTRSLLFVALAEGLAVLGFAVAMLIVMKLP